MRWRKERHRRPDVEDAARRHARLDAAGRASGSCFAWATRCSASTTTPPRRKATGFEVDKLNPAHVKAYMDTYLDNYQSAVGPLMGARGLRFLISDSWEAGAQNWTDDMIGEFTKRRGYDPTPVAARAHRTRRGERFGKRSIPVGLPADARGHGRGVPLRPDHEDPEGAAAWATTASRMSRAGRSIGDGMEVKRTNDVPMSAMWTQRPGVNEDQPGSNADIRESASVAHIYGQNLRRRGVVDRRFRRPGPGRRRP